MITTFNKFKEKLIHAGSDHKVQHFEAPIDGSNTDYVIEVDDTRLGYAGMFYNPTTNVVYLPSSSGALLADDSYWHFGGDEEHDFKLLKVMYSET